MTINASTISAVLDVAESVTLREKGLAYSSNHVEPGIRVSRLGRPYWNDAADFNFVVRIDYVTTGDGPFSVELLASANDTGPPGDAVCRVGIPSNQSGKIRALVPGAALRGINPGGDLYLACRLVIDGPGSSLDAAVSLERIAP